LRLRAGWATIKCKETMPDSNPAESDSAAAQAAHHQGPTLKSSKALHESLAADESLVARGPIRGPLRYEVETSSPSLEAGKIFTIYLRITNPYDVPVEVQDVRFELPVEFANETDREENHSAGAWWRQLRGAITKDGTTASPFPKTDGGGTNPFGPGVAIARGENRRPGGFVPANRLTAEELMWESVTIQPGNTVLRSISIRTRRLLFFSPAVYNLESQVRYVMDGQINRDAVKVPLSIKAPLLALVAGAAVGAFGGSLFQLISDPKELDKIFPAWDPFKFELAAAVRFGILLLSSVLLSAIVIVAFARKKDAQPFVSVEDFYGGLFVGFLVGINGASWLNFLSSGSTGAGSDGSATPSPASAASS
jgi:hypothetical protein